jgi:hypothetical protein
MECINCKNDQNYDFCPNCGEKSKTQKNTFSTILNEAFFTITNMD